MYICKIDISILNILTAFLGRCIRSLLHSSVQGLLHLHDVICATVKEYGLKGYSPEANGVSRRRSLHIGSTIICNKSHYVSCPAYFLATGRYE